MNTYHYEAKAITGGTARGGPVTCGKYERLSFMGICSLPSTSDKLPHFVPDKPLPVSCYESHPFFIFF